MCDIGIYLNVRPTNTIRENIINMATNKGYDWNTLNDYVTHIDFPDIKIPVQCLENGIKLFDDFSRICSEISEFVINLYEVLSKLVRNFVSSMEVNKIFNMTDIKMLCKEFSEYIDAQSGYNRGVWIEKVHKNNIYKERCRCNTKGIRGKLYERKKGYNYIRRK